MSHIKFEPEINKKGRKQWFYSHDDDYYLYRKHIFEFARKISNHIAENKNNRVLEIGPSTAVYKEIEFQQLNTQIISDTCIKNGVYYKTLDVVKESKCDYICNIEDMSVVREKFDIVILLAVIEHVPKIFRVPQQLYNITNEGALIYINTPYMFKVHGPIPDCWRFTEYGYKALFSELFNIKNIDTYPPNELGNNSIPLSFNVILQKKKIKA